MQRQKEAVLQKRPRGSKLGMFKAREEVALQPGWCDRGNSAWLQWRSGHGSPLQYSCLENPMDRGAWRAAVHGVTKTRTRLK